MVRGEYPRFPRFSGECHERVFFGGTVTYLSMQLAAYVGCNPIYLIGMDMSYRVPDYMEDAEILSREADVNHFHPDYFGPGKRWHDPQVDRMKKSIAYAGGFLARRGVRVYNATRGGELEELPRVAYEDVLGKRTVEAS